eukprot:CCRYP_010193-RD/>CCRYP_010193-RD protein AED:0.19 eAED:0.19 QI:178/0.76/0.94/1/0.70/0.72/18/313/577
MRLADSTLSLAAAFAASQSLFRFASSSAVAIVVDKAYESESKQLDYSNSTSLGEECSFSKSYLLDGSGADTGILGCSDPKLFCVEDSLSALGGRCALPAVAHRELQNTPACTASCTGLYACAGSLNPSNIGVGSCCGYKACYRVSASTVIGEGSCIGYKACYKAKDAAEEIQLKEILIMDSPVDILEALLETAAVLNTQHATSTPLMGVFLTLETIPATDKVHASLLGIIILETTAVVDITPATKVMVMCPIGAATHHGRVRGALFRLETMYATNIDHALRILHSPSTSAPTKATTTSPTHKPTTAAPTNNPTQKPTISPVTTGPTTSPTKKPTDPTKKPTNAPTVAPTKKPTTADPTNNPTQKPTNNPVTPLPTNSPTMKPGKNPTDLPINAPTNQPTRISSTFLFSVDLCYPGCGNFSAVNTNSTFEEIIETYVPCSLMQCAVTVVDSATSSCETCNISSSRRLRFLQESEYKTSAVMFEIVSNTPLVEQEVLTNLNSNIANANSDLAASTASFRVHGNFVAAKLQPTSQPTKMQSTSSKSMKAKSSKKPTSPSTNPDSKSSKDTKDPKGSRNSS